MPEKWLYRHRMPISNAYRVNQGLMPILKQAVPADQKNNNINDFYFIECESPELAVKHIIDLVKVRLPKKFNFSPFTDIQVLSPMIRGEVGTANLNIRLQNALVPHISSEKEVQAFGYTFRKGDKIMQTMNNYDKDVFNGDIGIIDDINKEMQEVAVTFDQRKVLYEYSELDQIVHAYATTIHKSQGSEYPVVIVPIMTQHYKMLQRNLIYTAITRAKKLIILIGQEKALNIAVKTASASQRYTTLKKHLVELTHMY